MLTTIRNHGAVRILRFNRPEALNAFNEAMFDAVAAELLAGRFLGAVMTGEGRFLRRYGFGDKPDRANPPEHGFAGMLKPCWL